MLINIKGKLMDLSQPRVMGIINVTDDSFHAASRYLSAGEITKAAESMLGQGADIIDVGGCSTRPGAIQVTEEVERRRVSEAVAMIRRQFPNAVISVDTYRSAVARESVVNCGADIINDISGGGMDDNMFSLVAEINVPYIMMHMQGTPETMQESPEYDDVVADIIYWFGQRIALLTRAGVKDIIIDPGFGFGKKPDHNFEILRRLGEFTITQRPILAGLSRKSMIWKTLGVTPAEALNGTSALNMAALLNGASILRVHDVQEARQVITLFEKIRNGLNLFDHIC